MRILQPTDWAKPRGFSHGVAIEAPGRWIVLAGQTGGDDKGDYSPDMAVQVGAALKRIIRLLAEAGAGLCGARLLHARHFPTAYALVQSRSG